MDPITGVTLGTKVIDATKHALWRTISVVCVVGVIALLVLGVKRILYPPKPEPTTTQNARIIENTYMYPSKTVFSFLNLWGFEVLSKHSYPEKPIITTRIVNATQEEINATQY